MRDIRGNDISMIFQEPMTSLNPVLTIGRQITETLTLHQGLDRAAADARAIEMLRLVGIPDPAQRLRQYPHELSGGMRQRVMIAMALACDPKLLIADEPTTALDVTVQAQILDIMRQLKSKTGAAIILITHSLGVVAEMAQRVVVMYGGRKVEEAPVGALFATPRHPYTQALLGSVPRLGSSLAGNGTRSAGRNSGRRAVAEGGHRRLHLRAPLRARDTAMPGDLSAAGGENTRPLGRLLGSPTGCWERRHERDAGPGGERPQEALSGAPGHVQPAGGRQGLRRGRHHRSPSTPAKRWDWWANPAAASPPPAS